MEIMREEILMNIPPAEDVPQKGTDVPKMSTPEPTARVNGLTQIRGQVLYLQNKLNEHLDRSKRRRDRL